MEGIHSVGMGTDLAPRLQDPSPRPENKQHLSYVRLRRQAGRLRHRQAAGPDLGHGQDGGGYALVAVARDLSRQEVVLQIRYVGSRVHPVGAVHSQASVRGEQPGHCRQQNSLR